MTPAAPTPRYTGPVLVDPASDGRKLVTDYSNPWGREPQPQPEPANDRTGFIGKLLKVLH
jgi:hypothetical protein